MARSIGEEELQLRKRARRRLIGAVVLVIAVVVALPMVLDSEPKPARQQVDIRMPSPESAPFTSKVVPLPEVPVTAKAGPEGRPEPPSGTVPPAPRAEAAPRTEKKAPIPAQRSSEPAFAVQIVALADAQKAKAMQQHIRAAGIDSYTERVTTATGTVTRVRAGPFTTREAAERAQRRLKEIAFDGRKFDAKVVPLK